MLHSCPLKSGSTSSAQLSLSALKAERLQSWPAPWSGKGGWVPTAGRASSDCVTGAPEGFRKGRSLPDRGCHRDEDSSGSSPAVPALEAPPATPSRVQGDAEGAGSAMMGSSISTCHCLCPCLPRLKFPWQNPSSKGFLQVPGHRQRQVVIVGGCHQLDAQWQPLTAQPQRALCHRQAQDIEDGCKREGWIDQSEHKDWDTALPGSPILGRQLCQTQHQDPGSWCFMQPCRDMVTRDITGQTFTVPTSCVQTASMRDGTHCGMPNLGHSCARHQPSITPQSKAALTLALRCSDHMGTTQGAPDCIPRDGRSQVPAKPNITHKVTPALLWTFGKR